MILHDMPVLLFFLYYDLLYVLSLEYFLLLVIILWLASSVYESLLDWVFVAF